MELAILFWFYKEEEICLNRLQLLRKYNPHAKIYGIYGGDRNKANLFKKNLSKYLNDFYICPYKNPDWKWINGDIVLLKWYQERGKNLNWDSLVVIQWDTLVFDSVKKLFPKIKKDEIFLSGLRYLDKKTEAKWHWIQPGSYERANFLKFIKYIKKHYNYTKKPLISPFILQVFPKIFFENYLKVKNKLIGMLEYKIPAYAKIFGLKFYKKDFGVCWFNDSKKFPLNAHPKEIEEYFIKNNLKKKEGWRVFHPYFKIWSIN